MLTILRGKGKRQVVLTYNPQYNHWINEEFFHPDGSPKRSDTFYLHTTYKDNPFVGQMYCQLIESLSKELYDLHGLGLPMKLEGLIYPDYHIIDVFPDIQFGYGVDKGFNDAFAVVQTGYDDGNLYGHEVAYERFKTPTQMIRLLTDLGVDKDKPWWFDDSATDTIYEFQHAGFNAMAAGKGKIIDGINKMKSCQLHMTASSLNMQKEIGSYLWAKGLDGKFKDEPAVALQDHALDAWRYGSINVIRAEFSPVHSSLFGKRRTASR
jgi:phage terminase large subunit